MVNRCAPRPRFMTSSAAPAANRWRWSIREMAGLGTVTVTPALTDMDGSQKWMIGVSLQPKVEFVSLPFRKLLWESARQNAKKRDLNLPVSAWNRGAPHVAAFAGRSYPHRATLG